MIELGYFLFTCKNFGVGPSIEVAEIRVEETYVRGNEKKFTVVVYYKLEERLM